MTIKLASNAKPFGTESEVRLYRDALLAETDAWALSDRTMTAEQTAYRQALRDIPNQLYFPEAHIWPEEPTT